MILVTGANGQLGFDVINELNRRNIDNIGIDIEDINLTDTIKVKKYLEELRPSAIIHCAGYTSVDKAESNEEERKKCIDINFKATENLSYICKEIDSKLLYLSTDYVFDGEKKGLYETSDEVNPMSIYGKSKADAEKSIINIMSKYFIVRTSWLFGENGGNFIDTIIKLSNDRSEIDVVDDQIGSPTYTKDLAPIICDLIASEKYGIYHITNEGFCSWAQLAEKVFDIMKNKCSVNHVSTRQYKTAIAHRPLNSRLSKDKIEEMGFEKLPDWESAVERYLNKYNRED